jgi:hypothetical protein
MGVKRFLALRKEHRLRVLKNNVLRRRIAPKRDEVTGEWRKLHSEELRLLQSYYQADQTKEDGLGGACSTHMRREENVQVSCGKARRKEATGKTKTYMGGWDQNGC